MLGVCEALVVVTYYVLTRRDSRFQQLRKYTCERGLARCVTGAKYCDSSWAFDASDIGDLGRPPIDGHHLNYLSIRSKSTSNMAAREKQLKRLCGGETLEKARNILNQVLLLCAPGSGHDVPPEGRAGLPAICAMIASEECVLT